MAEQEQAVPSLDDIEFVNGAVRAYAALALRAGCAQGRFFDEGSDVAAGMRKAQDWLITPSDERNALLARCEKAHARLRFLANGMLAYDIATVEPCKLGDFYYPSAVDCLCMVCGLWSELVARNAQEVMWERFANTLDDLARVQARAHHEVLLLRISIERQVSSIKGRKKPTARQVARDQIVAEYNKLKGDPKFADWPDPAMAKQIKTTDRTLRRLRSQGLIE